MLVDRREGSGGNRARQEMPSSDGRETVMRGASGLLQLKFKRQTLVRSWLFVSGCSWLKDINSKRVGCAKIFVESQRSTCHKCTTPPLHVLKMNDGSEQSGWAGEKASVSFRFGCRLCQD